MHDVRNLQNRPDETAGLSLAEILPKNLYVLLKELSKHEDELGYLNSRFEKLEPDLLWEELMLLEALEEMRLVELVGDKCEKEILIGPGSEAVEKIVRYRSTVLITYRGRCQLETRSKEKVKAGVHLIVETVAFLGGAAAVANLVLYIMWR